MYSNNNLDNINSPNSIKISPLFNTSNTEEPQRIPSIRTLLPQISLPDEHSSTHSSTDYYDNLSILKLQPSRTLSTPSVNTTSNPSLTNSPISPLNQRRPNEIQQTILPPANSFDKLEASPQRVTSKPYTNSPHSNSKSSGDSGTQNFLYNNQYLLSSPQKNTATVAKKQASPAVKQQAATSQQNSAQNDNSNFIKIKLKEIKKGLEGKKKFEAAVNQIDELLPLYLNGNTKQSFFGALKTASNRVIKFGFDPKPLVKLFQTSLTPQIKAFWTPGYLQNILLWKEKVEQIIAGTYRPENENFVQQPRTNTQSGNSSSSSSRSLSSRNYDEERYNAPIVGPYFSSPSKTSSSSSPSPSSSSSSISGSQYNIGNLRQNPIFQMQLGESASRTGVNLYISPGSPEPYPSQPSSSPSSSSSSSSSPSNRNNNSNNSQNNSGYNTIRFTNIGFNNNTMGPISTNNNNISNNNNNYNNYNNNTGGGGGGMGGMGGAPSHHHQKKNDNFNMATYPYLKFLDDIPAPLQPMRVPHSKPEVEHSFTILPQYFQRMTSEENGKKLEIRLCVYSSSELGLHSSRSVISPTQVSFRINKQPLKLSSVGKEVYFGYNISHLCQIGLNTLKIITTECCCMYGFGLRFVESVSVKSIIERISRNRISPEKSLEKIRQSFSLGGDIEQLYITISLLCPLGKLQIETPVRTTHCNHAQCFDLESFILLNKTNPGWKCPVCGVLANCDNLVVDEFLLQILHEVGPDEERESVKLAQDGTWELFDIEYNNNHSASESESEDEQPRKIQKLTASSDVATTFNPPSPVIIDLTL